MAVAYRTILAAVSLRINALIGTSASALEVTYTTSPLTSANFQSTIFNFTAVKDAILNAEEKLAQKIANNADDPLRQYMANVTTNQASPSTLPSVSTNSKPIIGIWGAVRDATSGIVCSQMLLDVVRRRSSATSMVIPCWWFNITGGRIEHTRTNVVVECCTYSRTDQATIFDANGDILLADALEPDYISEALAILVRDDEFIHQAQIFAARAGNSPIGNLQTIEGAAATP